MPRYDNNMVVIGAGSAGLVASLIGATVKAKVTLVERAAMGGDCLNTGCVPSKTLLASARTAHRIRTASHFGVTASAPEVDFGAVMRRVHGAIATIAPNDSVERYTQMGVQCVAGEAEILDPHHVRVGDRTLSTRSIILATGANPVVPPIPGLAAAGPLTSENLWSLQQLPKRLCVLGAGPIGCELAQAFARLGSHVTLVDMTDRVLPREDADVSSHLAEVLLTEGVDMRLGCTAKRVSDERQLIVESTAGETAIAFDEILVAVGRRANTDGLGLDALGVVLNPDGTVQVDEYLRTNCRNLFACGDVAGPYQFTHMASHQSWYAAVNAMFGRFWKFRINYAVVPWTTYTDPEVARVGLSVAEAQVRNIAVEQTRYDLAELDRAVAEGFKGGWVTVLTPAGSSDRILGATIVAPHAGELIAEWVLAMTHSLGMKKILGTIHTYPTMMEANKFTAGAWRRAHAPQGLLRWVERLQGVLR